LPGSTTAGEELAKSSQMLALSKPSALSRRLLFPTLFIDPVGCNAWSYSTAAMTGFLKKLFTA
jgi:hypothetical protein